MMLSITIAIFCRCINHLTSLGVHSSKRVGFSLFPIIPNYLVQFVRLLVYCSIPFQQCVQIFEVKGDPEDHFEGTDSDSFKPKLLPADKMFQIAISFNKDC